MTFLLTLSDQTKWILPHNKCIECFLKYTYWFLVMYADKTLGKQKNIKSLKTDDTNNPRENMKIIFPEILQPLLTQLVSKPYKGEPFRKKNPVLDTFLTFSILIVGIMAGILGWNKGDYFVPLSFCGSLLILHSSRKLRLTIMHACAHNSLLHNRHWNYLLGEFISILTITGSFPDYRQGHFQTHHSSLLMQPSDETYEYITKDAGFRLDKNEAELWQHLWKTLFSPVFYARQISKRLYKTFLSSSCIHNILCLTFWGLIVLTSIYLGCFYWFVLFWLIPLLTIFESFSLLRQCVEHRFDDNNTCHDSDSTSYMTVAIFCGEKTPDSRRYKSKARFYMAWLAWFFRIIFYHLPVRAFVLPGDSPVHDFHHRNPGSRKWIDCIYERQLELQDGVLCHEAWGLIEAISLTFKSFESKAREMP